IGLILLVTFASAQNLPSSVALLSQGVALGVTITIGMYFVRQCLARGNASQPIEYHTRLWLHTGVAMLANFGASVLINQTDTLMIGTLHGPADAGVYATASRLALLSLFGMESIQTFAGPMIAQLYADKRYGRLQQLLSWSTIGGILLALPVLLILIVWGEHVLGYFGLHFVRGYPALAILCVAQFVNIATGMTGLVMNMTGHHRQLAGIILCAAVGNLLLSAVLIPIYGIVGAACATTISSCGWNLAAVWFIRANLRLNLLAWRPTSSCEIS
ncbi:MAG TPA: polysaccharide biosynthesis C-terminal domain-containing protein, partial [Nitrospiraceae bacterium]|nr:polysaccharide biosynthesis C-terminal domain-containing protein [Nitrospiraceae bacterium]